MEEKLKQVEELLNEFVRKFEYRLRVKRAPVEFFHKELHQLEQDYLEAYPDKAENSRFVFDNLLQSFIADKEDNSFLDRDIPRLKSLLRDTLTALDESSYVAIDGDLVPNEEFKQLIRTGILTTSTPISSKFKGKTFVGY